MLTLLCLIVLSSFLLTNGQTITTELLNLKSENNLLLVEVAKRYPEVRFSKFEKPNKVLIELLDSKYHNQFKFDDLLKSSVLEGLDFVTDFTVGAARYEDNKTKISIILTLKEGYRPFPKVASTKGNIISISFNESIKQIPETEKSQTQEVQQESPPQGESTDPELESLKELYNSAVEKNIDGNIQQAEELYKELISKNNNFYPARYNLAKLYFDKADYEQSQNLLISLIADITINNQENNLLLISSNLLGRIYTSSNKSNEAIEQFNNIIKTNPSNYEAHYNLGITYEKDNDIEQALASFNKAIELKDDYIEAYYHSGILNLLLSNKKEAIYNLEKVFSLSPDSNLGKLSEKELQKLEKRKFKFRK